MVIDGYSIILLSDFAMTIAPGVGESKQRDETFHDHRQPRRYWRQLLQLKASAICIRLHRDKLAHQIFIVDLLKAIASSGGIAGWVIWRDWPFIWSGIIAAAQLVDAVKTVFPFAKHHKSANALTGALDLLCIDAEAEWEHISLGEIPAESIIERCSKLKRLQLAAEEKHFPDGFPLSKKLVEQATKEAQDYFSRDEQVELP